MLQTSACIFTTGTSYSCPVKVSFTYTDTRCLDSQHLLQVTALEDLRFITPITHLTFRAGFSSAIQSRVGPMKIPGSRGGGDMKSKQSLVPFSGRGISGTNTPRMNQMNH